MQHIKKKIDKGHGEPEWKCSHTSHFSINFEKKTLDLKKILQNNSATTYAAKPQKFKYYKTISAGNYEEREQ